MSLGDWIQNSVGRFQEDGFDGILESGYVLYRGTWRVACSKFHFGTNIYDRDWDALIILDGCRVDTLNKFANDYRFLRTNNTLTSVGSSSREWLAKTFTKSRLNDVNDTVYISANPYTNEILSPGNAKRNASPFNPNNWSSANKSDFYQLEEVWKWGWDNNLGTVPPQIVTDRAISISRKLRPNRLIIHYMQPHQPFIPLKQRWLSNGKREEELGWVDENCWNLLYKGEISTSQVMEAYEENLKLVLDNLSTLLNNLAANTVIISADHGNAFGEWGIYGHPAGFLHPSVKRVPWIKTTAEDSQEYEPKEKGALTSDTSVAKRLEDLGYL